MIGDSEDESSEDEGEGVKVIKGGKCDIHSLQNQMNHQRRMKWPGKNPNLVRSGGK